VLGDEAPECGRTLEVIDVDTEDNVLMVKGAVPGPNGGYVIVKLLERKVAPSYEQQKDRIREDAANDRNTLWRNERTRAARINAGLFEE